MRPIIVFSIIIVLFVGSLFAVNRFILNSPHKCGRSLGDCMVFDEEAPRATRSQPLSISREGVISRPDEQELLVIRSYILPNKPLAIPQPIISCLNSTIDIKIRNVTLEGKDNYKYTLLFNTPRISPEEIPCKVILNGNELDFLINIRLP